jgi:DNA mismatch repair protein MutS2
MSSTPHSPEAVISKLEFPVVLDRLADQCRFSVAAERALELGPSGELSTVRFLLDITAEAVDLITSFPDIAIGGARDIRGPVERAEKGGRLLAADILLVGDMLGASRNLKRSLTRIQDADQRFPGLVEFASHLADLPDLETDINRSIGPRGDVLDTASESLGRIRREVRTAQARLMDRLNSIVSGGRYATALQDAIITTRDGRYVVPIKAEARNQVPGVVHDTSASGQTLFIEPLDVVDLNNRWREAQLEEQREIDRILDLMSQKIGSRAHELNLTVDAVAAVDLAMAKARLAFSMGATKPVLWTGKPNSESGHVSHRIDLKRARHPLLDPKTVVPTNIEIGSDYRILLITGPNTGGKTVALKTVGLLTLMAQAGLYIPADDQSVVSVFPAVFADIGDEQSIAQSLSTFSAHMRNVIAMLHHVTADSLVLLDEMGAGTDPQEGSALARALIARLLELGPMVIATTHYSELKAYAYQTPGVENASVEFDVQTLAPTYRLMIGVPGRSNALAIARRLGMPEEIVSQAASLLDPDELRADALLQDIRLRRDESERILARAREAEKEAEQLRRIASRELREAEIQRQSAREEALARAESDLEEVRQTLRRMQRERATGTATREEVEQHRLEAEQAAQTVRTFRRERVARPVQQQVARIRPGDRVEIVSLGQEAEVISIEDETAELQMGSLKLRQPIDGLRRLGRAKPAQQERSVYRSAPAPYVPMEIDLRGQRAVEIEPVLEKYLQDAYLGGLPYVRIIHGKGTGALRQVVRDILKKTPQVERQETAEQNQGGDGATVAYMRES